MPRTNIEDDYFEWLLQIVCENRFAESHSYRRLLTELHDTEFTYLIPKDANREDDGIELRWRYASEFEDREYVMDCLYRPCSVLEMMIALAIRCEEDIMDDPGIGDRTGQWFWKMITNLGLGAMTDRRYDQDYVDSVIDRFLKREYDPDGRGGLFTVTDCEYDLRDVEIWTQLLWFLDNIT